MPLISCALPMRSHKKIQADDKQHKAYLLKGLHLCSAVDEASLQAFIEQ